MKIFQRSDRNTQTKRNAIRLALMVATYTASHHGLRCPASCTLRTAPSRMPGNCSPSSTKMMPLKVNCTVSHTAERCRRMLPGALPAIST